MPGHGPSIEADPVSKVHARTAERVIERHRAFRPVRSRGDGAEHLTPLRKKDSPTLQSPLLRDPIEGLHTRNNEADAFHGDLTGANSGSI